MHFQDFLSGAFPGKGAPSWQVFPGMKAECKLKIQCPNDRHWVIVEPTSNDAGPSLTQRLLSARKME